MKRLIFLSLVLTHILTGKAQSDTPTSGFCNDEKTCLWSLDSDGTMTISAKQGYENVKMKDFSCSADIWGTCNLVAGNRPWEANINNIKNIVVGDNIVTIGANAFQNATSLLTVSGMKDVKNLNQDAFWYATSLNSIYMPAVENIGNGTFWNTNLESIDIPNIKKIEDQAFHHTSRLEFAGIPEGVIFTDSGIFAGSKIPKCASHGECGSCGDKFVQAGVGCVSDCFDGYYPTNQGYCKVIKLRYTLPEADEATSNDNENMIEWIFE
ncbi:MAG: leucine-rich repeat domain-containing protein [Alphaproteobacteria bacterium]|nr:leucine-rich repeat domain-containing protein [Alphaproteobacteria bacterium]